MADRRSGAVLKHVETLFRVGIVGGLTDGQLLERFATRDGVAAEAAFESLVERHGAMVWRICSGVLDDTHDAEDASQATFLVLVRRAGSIRHRDSVASWLFGVASRIAARARVDAARRRKHERRRANMTTSSTSIEGPDDLGPLLHEEVGRLPEKYRAPVVICYLEGRTCEEASRRLGCPVGTIKVRLSRARDRLRARLTRRGLALPAGLAFAGLAPQAAPVAMPPPLVRATVRAALAYAAGRVEVGTISASVVGLSEGVLGVVCGTKLKMAALLAALMLLGTIPVRQGHPSDASEPPGPGGPAVAIAPRAGPTIIEVPGRTAYDPDTLVKIRLRYEAEVRGSHVSIGLRIKKGDPLVELFSTELLQAKSDFQTKFVQWQHDKKLYDLREKLLQTGAISDKDWGDTRNAEQKNRLDYDLALDKLQVFEVPQEEIDRLRDDVRRAPRIDDVPQKIKMNLRAPIDGIVIENETVTGNFYAKGQTLLAHAGVDHLELLYQPMLRAIVQHRVADRPDRFEPRMSKRKPKGYDRLTRPRKDIKREMVKGFSKN